MIGIYNPFSISLKICKIPDTEDPLSVLARLLLHILACLRKKILGRTKEGL